MTDTPQDARPDDEDSDRRFSPSERQERRSGMVRSILAVAIVVAGIVAGGLIGFAINFGACFKAECNAFEEGAMVYVPLASLLFTVPVAYALTRRRD